MLLDWLNSFHNPNCTFVYFRNGKGHYVTKSFRAFSCFKSQQFLGLVWPKIGFPKTPKRGREGAGGSWVPYPSALPRRRAHLAPRRGKAISTWSEALGPKGCAVSARTHLAFPAAAQGGRHGARCLRVGPEALQGVRKSGTGFAGGEPGERRGEWRGRAHSGLTGSRARERAPGDAGMARLEWQQSTSEGLWPCCPDPG